MVMAKQRRIGNCKRLNGIRASDGIRGILGIQTDSFLYWPMAMVASMTLRLSRVIMSFVQLQSLGGSRLRKRIIGAPSLRWRRCGGKPDGRRELRSSTG